MMTNAERDAMAHMLLAQREQIDAMLRLLYADDEQPPETGEAPPARKPMAWLGQEDEPTSPDER